MLNGIAGIGSVVGLMTAPKKGASLNVGADVVEDDENGFGGNEVGENSLTSRAPGRVLDGSKVNLARCFGIFQFRRPNSSQSPVDK